jgi:hypothetical protein
MDGASQGEEIQSFLGDDLNMQLGKYKALNF